MRCRPAADSAFSITALPSGARIASMPERGVEQRAQQRRSARSRFWHMKLAFCSQAGAAGSNPESPCASAKARSHGMAAARLDLSGLQRLGRQALHRIAVEIFDSHAATPLSPSLPRPTSFAQRSYAIAC